MGHKAPADWRPRWSTAETHVPGGGRKLTPWGFWIKILLLAACSLLRPVSAAPASPAVLSVLLAPPTHQIRSSSKVGRGASPIKLVRAAGGLVAALHSGYRLGLDTHDRSPQVRLAAGLPSSGPDGPG